MKIKNKKQQQGDIMRNVVKLKPGKDVIKQTFKTPTLEEYLNRDHVVCFYHPELDTNYQIKFNPYEREYQLHPSLVNKGISENSVPSIPIDLLEDMFRTLKDNWLNLSEKDKSDCELGCRFFLEKDDLGKRLQTEVYHKFISNKPTFFHSSLIDTPNGFLKGHSDLPLHFKRMNDYDSNCMEYKDKDSTDWKFIYGDIPVPKNWNKYHNQYNGIVSDTMIDMDEMMDIVSQNPNIRRVTNKGKIGRNQPCICGSGIKFKKCCLN